MRLIAALVLLTPILAHADPQAVLDAWLAAQNAGRFADYEALYAPSFRGVRRSGGKTLELDRAGWLRDRQRMFKRPMKVSVDKLKIEARDDGTHLTFTQTFASGSYGDVGEKELVLAEVGGKLLIAREELRSSSPLPHDPSCEVLDCKKATPDGQKAIVAACVKGCDGGDAWACRERANLFSDGACAVARDGAQAAVFYEKACRLKDGMACTFAAEIVEGAEPARAAPLYELGCKEEDPAACFALATLLRDGKGAPKDVKRAVELMDMLCREYARSGPGTNSCGELATMYKDGSGGVKKDRALAREYQQLLKEATSGE